MKANEAWRNMDALSRKDAASLRPEDFEELESRGFVGRMDAADYQAKQQEVGILPQLETELDDGAQEIEAKRKAFRSAIEQCRSCWHQLFTNSLDLKSERDRIFEQRRALSGLRKQRRGRSGRRDALKETEASLMPYVPVGEAYYALQPEAKAVLTELRVRLGRVDGVLLDDIVREIEQLNAAIDARYERFSTMQALLEEGGYKAGDPKVIQYALSLSGFDGDPNEVIARANVVNGFMYGNKWISYDRLAINAAVAVQNGDIEELRQQLEQIFIVMIEDGHARSYSTWSEAANIMKLPGGSVEEKYARFKAMDSSLSKRGWKSRSTACGYFAGHLAQKNGDVDKIASDFQACERILIEEGITDSVASGIAALILLNGQGANKTKAVRLVETLRMMGEYGLDHGEQSYGVAAAISLMPGTVEENVFQLQKMMQRLGADGYKQNLMGRAVALIGGGFRELCRQGVPVELSAYDVPSTVMPADDSGVLGGGLNLEWAVLGDLMDDGSLNLSGGALGGLLGGAEGAIIGGMMDGGDFGGGDFGGGGGGGSD